MKNDAVEKKDSDLLSRVRKLRERNISLQEETPEPMQAPPAIRVLPVILFVAGVSISVFLIYLGIKSDDSGMENGFEKTVSAGKNIAKKPLVVVRKRVIEKPPVSVPAEKQNNAVDRPVNSESPVVDQKDPETAGQAINDNSLSSVLKHPDGSAGTEVLDMYLSRAAVAEDIFELNPKGEKSIFKLGEDGSVVVWTEIISRKYPSAIRHVYFLNGRKYTQIPLKINYPRMRTWSRITLRSKTHAGDWSVSIENRDGKLLGKVDFKVVPAEPQEPGKE